MLLNCARFWKPKTTICGRIPSYCSTQMVVQSIAVTTLLFKLHWSACSFIRIWIFFVLSELHLTIAGKIKPSELCLFLIWHYRELAWLEEQQHVANAPQPNEHDSLNQRTKKQLSYIPFFLFPDTSGCDFTCSKSSQLLISQSNGQHQQEFTNSSQM